MHSVDGNGRDNYPSTRGVTSVDWDRDVRDKLRQRFVFRAKDRTLRQRVRYTLFKSRYSWIFEVVVSLVSVGWVATYVAGTYYVYSTGYPSWLQAVDYVLATFFALTWLIRWICTNNPFRYLILPYSILDYLTIIPIYFAFAGTAFLRVASILRIFRVLRPLKSITSVLIRQLSKLFFSLVALMFVAAALFLAIEPHTFQNFHTAFYFAVVTMTTVGFGDLSCKTTEGRYAVVALIFASTIVIPLQAYLLSRVLSAKKSPHEGGYNPEQGMSSVVLIADSQVETVKVRAFIEEFFCRYGSSDNKFEIVLLSADDPRPEVVKMYDTDYQRRMCYFKGKASNRRDLDRIKIDKAKAIVILSCDVGDPDNIDRESALQALAVKTMSKKVPTFVMARSPDNDALIEAAGRLVYTLSYDEIRLGILAHSMIAPGFSTLLMNLIITQSVRDEEDSGLHHSLWEYAYGAAQEIYFGDISRNFVGSTFAEASSAIYTETSAVLIGLVGERSIDLNPGAKTVLYGNETGIFIADTFIVAEELKSIKTNKSTSQPPRRLSAEFVSPERGSSDTSTMMGPVITYRNPITSSSVHDKDWMQRRFHTVEHSQDAQDLVIQDAKHIAGHFVVIGNIPCWEHLVAPLRSKVLERLRPIVILTETMPSDLAMMKLAQFPDVFVIIGSGLLVSDFKRAHISKSHKVAVLRNSSQTGDRDCLLVRNLLRRSYKNLDLIFEVDDPKTLDTLHRKTQANPLLYSQFRSGEACLASMATRILSQSVLNAYMLDVLQQLALWKVAVDVESEEETSSLQTNLFLMDVPKKFVGYDFASLFKSLITRKEILVLGLYRLHEGKPLRFVMTAPLPQTIIEATDQMYVLSRKHSR